MSSFTALDATKTGRQAPQLEDSLRRLVVGQDESIQQIVGVYQTHLVARRTEFVSMGGFFCGRRSISI